MQNQHLGAMLSDNVQEGSTRHLRIDSDGFKAIQKAIGRVFSARKYCVVTAACSRLLQVRIVE